MTILLLTVPVLLLILLLWLRRGSALNRAAQELCEARAQPGKRLRLLSPDRQVENLLAQINGLLEDREQETRTLREQEESLRRQIANISHDLRTPLTSILGYLQLLESEQLSPQQRRHYLEIVSDRAKVLQDLITAFYDLSRIEGGEYPLDLQPVDLRHGGRHIVGTGVAHGLDGNGSAPTHGNAPNVDLLCHTITFYPL